MSTLSYRKLELLPTELLASIRILIHKNPFDILISSDTLEKRDSPLLSPQTQCQLHLVNRRFRQLELSLSELWTYVDVERMGHERIQLQLQRSKRLRLSINLFIGDGPEPHRCVCDRLAIISSLKHRWKSCSIWAISNMWMKGFDHFCLDKLRDAKFPSLTHLVVHLVDPSAASVLKTWSVSGLECFKTREFDDADVIVQNSFSLDTLEWTIVSLPLRKVLPLQKPTFLKALELVSLNLRYLSINFHRVKWCYVLDARLATQVTLPSLKQFICINTVARQSPEVMFELLQRIRMPVVEELSLKFHEYMFYVDDHFTWFRSLKNPALKKVDVVIVGLKSRRRYVDVIRRLFLEGSGPGELDLKVINIGGQDISRR